MKVSKVFSVGFLSAAFIFTFSASDSFAQTRGKGQMLRDGTGPNHSVNNPGSNGQALKGTPQGKGSGYGTSSGTRSMDGTGFGPGNGTQPRPMDGTGFGAKGKATK